MKQSASENGAKTSTASVHDPFVSASWVGTDVIQFHFLLGGSTLTLEEDGFRMTAFGTRVILSSGQRRVGDDVGDDLRESVHLVSDFVDVDARVIGGHAEFAISTAVHENALLLVLFWIQHVVAFLAESNTDEAGTLVGEGGSVEEIFLHFAFHHFVSIREKLRMGLNRAVQ